MLDNKTIAIVRLSAIGDVLNCTPVAAALRAAAPRCRIIWIVSPGAADMVLTNPDIDEVFVWSRQHWEELLRRGRFRMAWQAYKQLKLELKKRHIDIALDVHGLFISGVVTLATGAPRRIGLGGTKELNWAFMTEQAPVCPAQTHVIRRYLSILQPLGIVSDNTQMVLHVPATARRFAQEFLARAGVGPDERILAINPATTWASKNWPPEYYAEVIAAVHPKLRVLLCGGPDDRRLGRFIVEQAGVPVVDAIGATSLLELAALLERCSALICGDTGPLHMAVALGTPTVSIFGPTDPRRHGPLNGRHIVLQSQGNCRNCYKYHCRHPAESCMRAVTPAAVLQALDELLAGR